MGEILQFAEGICFETPDINIFFWGGVCIIYTRDDPKTPDKLFQQTDAALYIRDVAARAALILLIGFAKVSIKPLHLVSSYIYLRHP